MPGFERDPLADIGLIKDLLERQYAESSVAIELLQNADDRHARRVTFVWHPGFPDATSVLLRGPQLIAINDGEFEARDAHAIRRFRVGAKGADSGSIGKYGLGLKAVFHFGEAFFWGAGGSPGAPVHATELLNPWFDGASGRGKHADWEVSAGSWLDDIAAKAARQLGYERWFFIAIPLRARAQLQGVREIVSVFPGDDPEPPQQVFGAATARTVAGCLPLLRHIEQVAWLRADGTDLRTVHGLRLSAGSTRRTLPPDVPTGVGELWASEQQHVGFRGTGVLVRDSGSRREEVRFTYAGREVARGQDGELAALARDKSWPTSTVVNDDGSSEHVPDPARPTAAVCILRWGSDSALRRIDISWHAFTPLAESFRSMEPNEASGALDVQIALHGYFFVDAGRRDLTVEADGSRDEGAVVRAAWNRRLMATGTLPLVPLALADFVRDTAATPEQVADVTAALLNHPRVNRRAASTDLAWVFRHGLEPTWQVVPSTCRFVAIPRPGPDVLPRIERLLPAFSNSSGARVAVYIGVPAITPEEPEVLSQDELATLLPHDLDALARDDEHESIVDYLVQLVSLTLRGAPMPSPGSRSIGAALPARLVGLAQALALRGHLGNGPEAAASAVGRLVKLLPESASLYVPAPRHDAEEALFRFAYDRQLPAVLRPGRPPADHRVTLDPSDASRLIAFVEKLDSVTDAERSDLARIVLGQLDRETRREVLRASAAARLFDVAVNGERRRMVSWRELETAAEQGTLFKKHALSHASELASCVEGVAFIEISADTAAVLFDGLRDLPTCSASVAVDRLLAASAISPRSALRRPLLERFLDLKQPPDGLRRAVRYLLHGDGARRHDDDTVLLADGVGTSGALTSLLRHALGTGNSWRIVDGQLASCLNPTQSSHLRVAHVSEQLVSMEVVRRGSMLDPGAISEDERKDLLRRLTLEALCLLRIHRTVDGLLVAIDEHVYCPGNADPPSCLAGRVHVLDIENDPDLRARQLALVDERKFSVSVALQLLLRQQCSQAVAADILETMKGVRDYASLPEDVHVALRSTAWVPTPRGPKRPCELVDTGLAAWVGEALLTELRAHLVFADTVGPWLTKHSAWNRMATLLLPKRPELIQILAAAMSTVPELRLGIDEGEVPGLLDAMAGGFAWPGNDRSRRRPRGLDLVEAALDERLARSAVEDAARRICGDTTVECLRQVVMEIPDAHGPAVDKECIALLHLRALGRVTRSREALRGLRLLSRDRRWVDAAQLCVDVPGASDSSQLSYDHATALGSIVDEPEVISAPRPTVAAGSLADFLAGWPLSSTAAIGTFLALLGDGAEVRSLAAKYADESRVEGVRTSVAYDLPRAPGSGVPHDHRLIDWDLLERQKRTTLAIAAVPDADRLAAVNLLGEPITVPADKASSHLLVGRPEFIGALTYEVRLRMIDAAAKSTVDLERLLRETAYEILVRCFKIAPKNLDQVWEFFCKASQQLDIEVVRRTIVEDSLIFLRQLGLTRCPTLGAALKRVHQMRRDVCEAEEEAQGFGREQLRTRLEGLRVAYRDARQELQRLIDESADAQQEILEAIRGKVANEYQYGPDRVLFELFQNADDAAAEGALLDELAGVSSSAAGGRFVVGIERDVVWIAHWGRNVNEWRLGTVDMRSKGFDHDLENMLVLSISEKTDPGRVTGKFGLGFKSVFLLSPLPRLLSGRLAVEIVGGVLPRPLSGEATTELVARLASVGESSRGRGTLLVLPGASRDLARLASDEFSICAPILAAFARRTRTVEIREDGRRDEHTWAATLFGGAEWSWTADSAASGCAFVMLAAGAGRAGLLLSTRNGVFQHLPPSTPTIWSTAPTGERHELGFAMNGAFALDVGRAQIARAVERNETTAREMGRNLGAALIELADAVGSAENVVLPWHTEAISRYALWESLWNIVAVPLSRALGAREARPPGLEIVRCVLCGDPSVGLARFFAARRVVPTQLPGRLCRLVALGDIQMVASGILDRTDVCESVSDLPGTERVLPSGAVASARVVERLRQLGMARNDVSEVRVASVLRAGLIGSPVSPESAKLLGSVLCLENDGQFQLSGANERDGTELRELLPLLVFPVRQGPAQPATSVLVPTERDSEEGRVGRFAPPGYLLSHRYDEVGVRFIRFCRRGPWVGDLRLIERWALDAPDEEARKAVLEYVSNGRFGREVARYLRDNDCPWAEDAVRLLDGSELDEAEKFSVAVVIGAKPPSAPESDDEKDESGHDAWASDALEQIAAWWKVNRASALRRYEHQTYPDGCPFVLSADDDFSTSEARERWVAFLTLGCLQSMGRTQPEAHRNFVAICKAKGWIAMLSDPGRRQDLLREIDAFAQGQDRKLEWLQWVKELVGPFIASRNLEDHVRAMLAMDAAQDGFPLRSYLAPRTHPGFSGGGPDAPPLINVLGIGSHLVVRDLRRAGVLRSSAVDRHCYTPTRRVRRLLGFDQPDVDHFDLSVRIWEMVKARLGDGSFFGDYDIPLLAAMDDPDVRERLRVGV